MNALVWRPGRPVDVAGTLGCLVRGPYDPVQCLDADGTFWKAARTPDGPATLAIRPAPDGVRAQAWGDGAGWLLERVPALLGEGDDWSLDLSEHAGLAAVARRHQGVRLCATGLVLDALVPAILEQRVTHAEARRAWTGLVKRYGVAAPGPRAGLFVPPAPEALLRVPTWTWHRLGVDPARQRPIRAAATVASRLEEGAAMAPAAARARLRVVPGVGEWTAAETTSRALADPDAVSVGDYHLANHVVHYFTGRARGSDEEMLDLLAPWEGQRARIVRLVLLSGVAPPKFGPRFAANDIRAI